MTCHLCPSIIILPDGSKYGEAHAIHPLGGDHAGYDVAENIICVCPNCHAKLDLGAIRLMSVRIESVPGQSISTQYIRYHNEKIVRG